MADFDPTRPTSARSRAPNRYTRADLIRFAQRFGVYEDNLNMNQLAKRIKVAWTKQRGERKEKEEKTATADRNQSQRPLPNKDRCYAAVDPITQEAWNDAKEEEEDRVYIILPIERRSKDAMLKAHCYERDSIIGIMENSNRVYQWDHDRPTACCPYQDAPVYKEPYAAVFLVAASLDALRDKKHNVYVAYELGPHTIGTEFTQSSTHGAVETLYLLIPLPDTLLKQWWAQTLTSGAILDHFLPQKAALAAQHLRPYGQGGQILQGNDPDSSEEEEETDSDDDERVPVYMPWDDSEDGVFLFLWLTSMSRRSAAKLMQKVKSAATFVEVNKILRRELSDQAVWAGVRDCLRKLRPEMQRNLQFLYAFLERPELDITDGTLDHALFRRMCVRNNLASCAETARLLQQDEVPSREEVDQSMSNIHNTYGVDRYIGMIKRVVKIMFNRKATKNGLPVPFPELLGRRQPAPRSSSPEFPRQR